MKNNQAFIIALAIIIGAGDRLIAALESGKSPAIVAITGLVGAAIAVKFLMEQRPPNAAEKDTDKDTLLGTVTGYAEQKVTEAVTQTLVETVVPNKRTQTDGD